jgi:hypothetical protein
MLFGHFGPQIGNLQIAPKKKTEAKSVSAHNDSVLSY